MSRIQIVAREGCVVPRENLSGKIDSKTPVSVTMSRYYWRLLAEGSLQIVQPAAPAPVAKKGKQEESK